MKGLALGALVVSFVGSISDLVSCAVVGVNPAPILSPVEVESPAQVFSSWANKIASNRIIEVFPKRIKSKNARGMVVTQPLPVSEEPYKLFSIPVDYVLSPSAAITEYPYLAQVVKNFPSWTTENGWMTLILYVCLESQNPTSRFKEYLDVLPTESDGFETWSAEEVDEFQDVNQDLSKHQATISNSVNHLFSHVQRHSELNMTYSTFAWASFVVRSRARNVPSLGGECLVPIFDMANHSPKFFSLGVFANGTDVDILFDGGENALVPGDEILNFYRSGTNEEYLRSYGFVDENNMGEEYVLKEKGRSMKLKATVPGSPRCNDLLSTRIESELHRFPSSEIQDLGLLDGGSVTSHRLWTAIQFRMQKKRLLRVNCLALRCAV